MCPGNAGKAGEVGRLEDELAKARAAEGAAKAQLLQESAARQTEAAAAAQALDAEKARANELQSRLEGLQDANERLLRDREVSITASAISLQLRDVKSMCV